MNNIISSILILLAILVFTSSILVSNAMTLENTSNIQQLNTCTEFLETVTDKSAIRKEDLEELNLELSKTGVIIDYTIEVSKRVVYKNKIVYVSDNIIEKKDTPNFKMTALNTGDKVHLTVERQSKTNSEKLINVLAAGLSVTQRKTSMVRMVR